MTYLRLTFIALTLCLLSCKEKSKPNTTETQAKAYVKLNVSVQSDTATDKQEIQKLIRNLLIWAEDHKEVPDLLPFVINQKDSTVTSFNLSKLQGVDDSLKTTGFFRGSLLITTIRLYRCLIRR